MKLATLFMSLSIMLIALPMSVQSADLVGEWCVSMSTAFSEGTVDPPGFFEEEYEIEIIAQVDGAYGVLFYGQVWVGIEYTYFSGVLDGDEISMTHWDSVTRGKLKQKKDKPLQINFINNAFDSDDRSGKTSIGIVVKGTCPQP